MASAWSVFSAMFRASRTGGAASTARRATRSGREIAHSSACIPPIDPPMTAAKRSMPSSSASLDCAATWSRIVVAGKRAPYSRPRASRLEGPVVPWQPPSMLLATTNQRSVSMGRPGPMRPGHHPAVGWPGPASPSTWASPVSAWQMRIAFERSGASSPQVS